MVYGLLTTISNLGSPFSRAVGNQIFGLFKPNLSDNSNYVADTPEFRDTVALSFGISYMFSFASMVALVADPTSMRCMRAWTSKCVYISSSLARDAPPKLFVQ